MLIHKYSFPQVKQSEKDLAYRREQHYNKQRTIFISFMPCALGS